MERTDLNQLLGRNTAVHTQKLVPSPFETATAAHRAVIDLSSSMYRLRSLLIGHPPENVNGSASLPAPEDMFSVLAENSQAIIDMCRQMSEHITAITERLPERPF